MAKRPYAKPGEVCNPLKAAALISVADGTPHYPVNLTRRPDGVLVTTFEPTIQFLADCEAYESDTLPVFPKMYLRVRSRLLDMKDDSRPASIDELIRTVQAQ